MAQRRFDEYKRLADAQIEEIMRTMMTIKIVSDRASTMKASQNLKTDEDEEVTYMNGTIVCSDVRVSDILLKQKNSDELFEQAFEEIFNEMYSDD